MAMGSKALYHQGTPPFFYPPRMLKENLEKAWANLSPVLENAWHHLKRQGSVLETASHFASKEWQGNSPLYAESLVKKLGQLKGPFMKMAQLTATVPGLLPEPLKTACLSLCTQAPSMAWPLTKRRLAQHLGPQWSSSFAFFEKTPSFSASLGQVHRAVLTTGDQVACKVQYPHMKGAVQTDMKWIALAKKLWKRNNKAFDLDELIQHAYTLFLGELDYTQEAKNMETFEKLFHIYAIPGIDIPKIIPSLCTKEVITMSWMPGIPLSEGLQEHLKHQASSSHRDHAISEKTSFSSWQGLLSQEEYRRQLGAWLLQAWYRPFFQHHIMHGDPHGGNILLQEKGISLVDWGCVQSFPKTFVQGVKQLYKANYGSPSTKKGRPGQRKEAYHLMGLSTRNQEILDALDLWMDFILAPFLTDQSTRMSQICDPQRGHAIFAQVQTQLAKEGGITLPQEFLIFDRVAVILGSFLIHLDVSGPWGAVFSKCLQDSQALSP